MTTSNRSQMFSSHLSGQPKDAFGRMCDNLDAQNQIALESGTLPPEEEAILREVMYPEEVIYKAYLKKGHEGESFEDFQKRYALMSDSIRNAIAGAHSQDLGNWLQTRNHLSTRGEILNMGEGCIESDGIETDYDVKAPDPGPVVSSLLQSLLRRI